jgi:hypothetical protein
MHERFWWETLKESHHLEDQTPDGRIILNGPGRYALDGGPLEGSFEQ